MRQRVARSIFYFSLEYLDVSGRIPIFATIFIPILIEEAILSEKPKIMKAIARMLFSSLLLFCSTIVWAADPDGPEEQSQAERVGQ